MEQTVKADILNLLKDLSGISVEVLRRMNSQESGLFCEKLRERPSGELEVLGVSTLQTIIAGIGLASVSKKDVWRSPFGQAMIGRLSQALLADSTPLDVGELALYLWFDGLLEGTWRDRVLDRLLVKWDWARRWADSMTLAWLLTGLLQTEQGLSGREKRLLDEVLSRLLKNYSPATRLFRLGGRGRLDFGRRYKSTLGSFASQIYPVLALSVYHQRFPDQQIAQVVKGCADRICELQGPEGEWWWVYDVRDSAVLLQYPVYSVHQDSMAPMGLFSAMMALPDRDYTVPAWKGLRYVCDTPTALNGDRMLSRERGVIWRAVVRDLPGPYPGSTPFGLSPLEMRTMRLAGLPNFLRRPQPPLGDRFRLLKEARPYCAGWILFAYSRACRLLQQEQELEVIL